MFKTLLILVLVFAGIRFVKNIILMPNKKEKRDYQKMDIQDAEYKEINDE